MTIAPYQPDPRLDLVLQREVNVSPDLVWLAWTRPEHVKRWFAPQPWQTVDCKIDLRPGGEFSSVMRSPDGQEFPNVGCYLEIVENRKLVFTDALTSNFRPAARPFFTAMVLLEANGKGGTKYTAIGMHRDEASRKQHEARGFQHGWSVCLDQLVAHVKQL